MTAFAVLVGISGAHAGNDTSTQGAAPTTSTTTTPAAPAAGPRMINQESHGPPVALSATPTDVAAITADLSGRYTLNASLRARQIVARAPTVATVECRWAVDGSPIGPPASKSSVVQASVGVRNELSFGPTALTTLAAGQDATLRCDLAGAPAGTFQVEYWALTGRQA